MKRNFALILIILTPVLAGCEQLGMENPAAEQARAEAEGKAIGSGCRQTGRALEDCYQLNRRAPKAAIFAGWREMDAYMRENKIEEIKPDAPAKAAETARPSAVAAEGEKALEKKAASKEPGTSARTAPEAKPAEAQAARKARSPLSR